MGGGGGCGGGGEKVGGWRFFFCFFLGGGGVESKTGAVFIWDLILTQFDRKVDSVCALRPFTL